MGKMLSPNLCLSGNVSFTLSFFKPLESNIELSKNKDDINQRKHYRFIRKEIKE